MARPWFRFHLLTLVLLTGATGALVGANVAPRNKVVTESGTTASYGWPKRYSEPIPELKGRIGNPYVEGGVTEFHIRAFQRWDTENFLIDVCVALLTLISIAFTSEYFLRRRAPPALQPDP